MVILRGCGCGGGIFLGGVGAFLLLVVVLPEDLRIRLGRVGGIQEPLPLFLLPAKLLLDPHTTRRRRDQPHDGDDGGAIALFQFHLEDAEVGDPGLP